ncbi:hypothetical protein HYN48_14205 [Flavobacterium magnum]|uniref:Thioredoxin domain-containing protein n=2 Tax=Flavobacterium magnum TaxID=2162713 RepID=A0A2S0RH31_9FLAO|nr:hypothetical protein HYN48_13700 [Flavobacterium magnum]AWA31152.1 hypothetical protein HYN48_14205 [Flavobacterium magnum]
MLPVGSNADEIAKRIQQRDSSKIGTRLPTFVAGELDDSIFYSADTTRITFYYFWYDCGEACFGQIDALNELQKKYSGNVDFISVTNLNKTRLLEVIEKKSFNFKHCMITQEEINNLGFANGYPLTLITVDGVIKLCKSGGPITHEAIEKWKDEYMKVLNTYL